MDADLLLVGQAESVFTDESDRERLAVHGLLPTGPVHKLILRLQKSKHTFTLLCLFIRPNNLTMYNSIHYYCSLFSVIRKIYWWVKRFTKLNIWTEIYTLIV